MYTVKDSNFYGEPVFDVFETGQVRMWVEERVERGPVLLLKKHTYTTPSCNKIEGWVCERMPPGTHPFFVPSHRLGRLLTEMEVVAWASK